MKEHRIIGAASLLLLAYLFVGAAQAQTRATDCSAATPNDAVCLTWSAVTKDTTGAAVSGVTYRIEQRAGFSGSWATITQSQTDTKRYVEKLATGTYFFRVYANCATNCLESAASNTASKAATAPAQVPEAPVITIAVVIGMDHAPVYRLTQAGKRDQRYADACGYIEVGKKCSGPVVFRFRDKSFRRVSAADVKPWADCGANVVAPCS